ncbi:MAG: hypothetical protein ACJ76Z_09550 [Thermoleophilaceae bacterium]
MNSWLTMEVVKAIHRDRSRNGSAPTPRRFDGADTEALVIRPANGEDAARLERLAQLDSAPTPSGPTLVAELDGVLVAALPLYDGAPVADPFVRSAPFLKMLEMRRTQLRGFV